MNSKDYLLVADIGGTNSRLYLIEVDPSSALTFEAKRGLKVPGRDVLTRSFLNQDYPSLSAIVEAFISEAKEVKKVNKVPAAACFAVAGPVKNNRVSFTNRNWDIDGNSIGAAVGIPRVELINDFVAVGYGLLTLDANKDCVVLQEGTPMAGPIACVGAGTGLGQCYLCPINEGGEYACFASEGGHTEFSPRDDIEYGLQKYLKDKFMEPNRISVERVVSGMGLLNMYEYFCSIYPDLVNEQINASIASAGDLKGKVIAENRMNCKLCHLTMQEFVRSYGAECGAVALKFLCTGGLFLCGGLTPKNIDLIKDPQGPFMATFLDKGRLTQTTRTIPVYAVMDEKIGLWGAHYVAFRDYCRLRLAPKNGSETNGKRAQDKNPRVLKTIGVAALLAVAITSAFLLGRSSLRNSRA